MKKDCLIKELESNLNEQKEVNHRQLAEINLLNDRLNNEARRIKSLERESDRLRSEISLLESKVSSQFKIIANSYNNFFKDIIKYKIRSSDFFYIIEILSLFSATLLFSFSTASFVLFFTWYCNLWDKWNFIYMFNLFDILDISAVSLHS